MSYTKPELRERIKSRVMASGDGGKPGQWSARKAQLVAQKYEAAGGGYSGAKTEGQKSLSKWTKEKWTTSDGKPAERKGGTTRYLPEKAWDKLSPGERAATNAKKREGSREGKQFVQNTEAAAEARKEAMDKAAVSEKWVEDRVRRAIEKGVSDERLNAFKDAMLFRAMNTQDKLRGSLPIARSHFDAAIYSSREALERLAKTKPNDPVVSVATLYPSEIGRLRNTRAATLIAYDEMKAREKLREAEAHISNVVENAVHHAPISDVVENAVHHAPAASGMSLRNKLMLGGAVAAPFLAYAGYRALKNRGQRADGEEVKEAMHKKAFLGPALELEYKGGPSALGYLLGRARPITDDRAKEIAEANYELAPAFLVPGYTGYYFGSQHAAGRRLRDMERRQLLEKVLAQANAGAPAAPAKEASEGGAWQRSEGKNPEGGLNAKGRASLKAQGHDIKPGVKGPADTPEKQRRKGSFLSRMFGPGAPGSMKQDNGEPSRRALSAKAWGEPVPQDDAGRARLYAKGQALLKKYKGGKKEAEMNQIEAVKVASMLDTLKSFGVASKTKGEDALRALVQFMQRSPTHAASVLGGMLGTVGGGALGAATAGPEESRILEALSGAGKGAIIGTAAGALGPNTDVIMNRLSKFGNAPDVGRVTKFLAGRTPAEFAKRMGAASGGALGTGIGAIGGGIYGGLTAGPDESVLGGAARGAAKGAIGGGVIGAGAGYLQGRGAVRQAMNEMHQIRAGASGEATPVIAARLRRQRRELLNKGLGGFLQGG